MTTSGNRGKRKKNRALRRLLNLLITVGLIAGGVWYAKDRGLFQSTSRQPIRGAQVERGTLEIQVVEKGNLKAKDAVSLKSELEGRATVISLVAEGTMVSAGDLLVELDASGILDRKIQQEISVQNAEASYTKAREAYEIQSLQNESDIAAARQTLDFAHADLRKYEEGDWPQTLRKADEDIVLAREELSRAEERHEWSKDLAEKGFLTRTELEGDRLSYERNRILLDQTERAKQLLIDFDNPKELRRLNADVEEAERELRRVERQASARMADAGADRRSAEAKLNLEREQLEKLVSQLGKAAIHAPIDGMVVYGREEGSRWRGGDPISEGVEVRERQELISIPTAGGMVVEASIHESVLKKVEVGQSVTIAVDALPGRTFKGEVSYLAVLPDQNSWWANPDLRLYKCEVSMTNAVEGVRPGMSCAVTIFVDRIEDTLLVPLQSVFPTERGTLVFVPGADGEVEERLVRVGANDETRVEILEGVREGETVLLSPPEGFDPSGGEEEEGPGEGASPAKDGTQKGPGGGGPGGGGRGKGGRSGGGAASSRPRGSDAGKGSGAEKGTTASKNREGGSPRATSAPANVPSSEKTAGSVPADKSL